MTTNINVNFKVPTEPELRKSIKTNPHIVLLQKRLEDDTDLLKWLEELQQSHINDKKRSEESLLASQNEINRLRTKAGNLKAKVAKAKEWMANPTRNIEKDGSCIIFQHKALEEIKKVETEYIPNIENQITKANYAEAIKWNEKYIKNDNKPAQVYQRLQNDAKEVLKRIESYIVTFYSSKGTKGKEDHLANLRAQLAKPLKLNAQLLENYKPTMTLEQRIANVESQIAFRKMAEKRPNNQVLKTEAETYLENERKEIEAICYEAWIKYLDRIYFKGGMEAFYI